MIYDPQGQTEGGESVPYADREYNLYNTAAGADAVVVITEWNVYRGLELVRLKKTMDSSIFVDPRNNYSFEDVDEIGMAYFLIGKHPQMASCNKCPGAWK